MQKTNAEKEAYKGFSAFYVPKGQKRIITIFPITVREREFTDITAKHVINGKVKGLSKQNNCGTVHIYKGGLSVEKKAVFPCVAKQ